MLELLYMYMYNYTRSKCFLVAYGDVSRWASGLLTKPGTYVLNLPNLG